MSTPQVSPTDEIFVLLPASASPDGIRMPITELLPPGRIAKLSLEELSSFVDSGPGGADGDFQFNDGGALGGASDVRYDGATGQLLVTGGTNPEPGYSFIGDQGTGMYSDAAGTIRWALSNAFRMELTNAALTTVATVIRAGSLGSAGAPTWAARLDIDTGAFYPLSNRLGFSTAGAERGRFEQDGGFLMTGATGGSQGAGTINAQGVYDDGVLLTPYVFERYRTGAIDLAALESAVPPAVEECREDLAPGPVGSRATLSRPVGRVLGINTAERAGDGSALLVVDAAAGEVEWAEDLRGEGSAVVVYECPPEPRQHGPARRFDAAADEELDPRRYASKVMATGHLPSLPSDADWRAAGGKVSVGRIVQGLSEALEVACVHNMALVQEVDALRADVDRLMAA